VLDGSGKARFYGLRANRGTVVFAAFHLTWLNGRDMRDLPLLERKEILRLSTEVSLESRDLR
jgi:ATP-dependent DNA ligase